MKKALIVLSFLFASAVCFAQKSKADSIAAVKKDSIETEKYYQSIFTDTNIKELQEWARKNVTNEAYEFFVIAYNAFVQRKLQEYLSKKKK